MYRKRLYTVVLLEIRQNDIRQSWKHSFQLFMDISATRRIRQEVNDSFGLIDFGSLHSAGQGQVAAWNIPTKNSLRFSSISSEFVVCLLRKDARCMAQSLILHFVIQLRWETVKMCRRDPTSELTTSRKVQIKHSTCTRNPSYGEPHANTFLSTRNTTSNETK